MIRQAALKDLPAVVSLGIEALETDPYPGLVISPDRVKAVATDCISSACNFAWVSEVEGDVVAAVCAQVHDMQFYERKQATVVQFYTRHPGAGIPLIRKFLKWARSRGAIKLIVFTLECRADPRIGSMLERMGLSVELPVYLEIK